MIQRYIITVLFILLSLAGCQSVPKQEGVLEQTVADTQISSRQLGILIYEFFGTYSDSIEEAADEIQAGTSDPEVYRNALYWKINAVTTTFRVAARRDALVAFVDLWVFCQQMTQFLRDGKGSHLFGPHQMIAVGFAMDMETKVEEIAFKILGNNERVEETTEIIRTKIKDHPLNNLNFVRPSIAGLFLDHVKSEGKRFVEVVGSLTQDLQTAQLILMSYMNELPDMARWQTELLLLDAPSIPINLESIKELEPILACVERITDVAEQTPALLQQESEIAINAIHKERVESFDEIERMRLDTLREVDGMRIETLGVVDQMRIESFADIQEIQASTVVELKKEREIVFNELRKERIAAFDDIDELQDKTMIEIDAIMDNRIEEFESRGAALIDHLMWRLTQLMGGVGVALLVAFIVFRKLGAA